MVALATAKKMCGKYNKFIWWFVIALATPPSPTPQKVSVKSAGRMEEVITGVRCGVDSTMFLTETGRVYACGK